MAWIYEGEEIDVWDGRWSYLEVEMRRGTDLILITPRVRHPSKDVTRLTGQALKLAT